MVLVVFEAEFVNDFLEGFLVHFIVEDMEVFFEESGESCFPCLLRQGSVCLRLKSLFEKWANCVAVFVANCWESAELFFIVGICASSEFRDKDASRELSGLFCPALWVNMGAKVEFRLAGRVIFGGPVMWLLKLRGCGGMLTWMLHVGSVT